MAKFCPLFLYFLLSNYFLFSDMDYYDLFRSYTELEYKHYSTSHFWDSHCKKRCTYNHFDLQEIRSKTNLKLNRYDSVSFTAGYDYINEELDGKTIGFNDFELKWDHIFFNNSRSLWGTKLIAIIPPNNKYLPGIRYGNYGIEVGIFYLKNLQICNYNSFIYTDLSYRSYSSFASDQIRNTTGLAIWLRQNLSIDLKSDIYYGFFNGRERLNRSLVSYNPNYRLLKAEVEVAYYFTNRTAVKVSYFQDLIGQNVGTGGGFSTSLQVLF